MLAMDYRVISGGIIVHKNNRKDSIGLFLRQLQYRGLSPKSTQLTGDRVFALLRDHQKFHCRLRQQIVAHQSETDQPLDFHDTTIGRRN